MNSLEEKVLRGLPISKGIGIGVPVFFANQEEHFLEEFTIPQKEIEDEIERYRKALEKSRSDVETLQKLSLGNESSEVVSILGAHLEMMKDPLLTSVIEEKIRQMQRNTESIFRHIIEEYKLKFSRLKDSYFRERVRDIVDVSRRILGHLRPLERIKISEIPQNSVVLAHELIPSDTVEANNAMVKAFVSSSGGITSHAAIIARAKGIPYVANIDMEPLQSGEVESIIVDGSEGLVILNPGPKTLKKYRKMQKDLERSYRALKSFSLLKGETIDGYAVNVFANLENPTEIDQIVKGGAIGIGLFRSEYLFLHKKVFPPEEEQFLIYKKMVKALKGRPLTVRIFDVGGDKKVGEHLETKFFKSLGSELNPALGCRAIRFLLRYPEILDSQLRAIVRASVFGPVKILIPMVSDLSELKIVRKKVEELQKEFKGKGRRQKPIPIGCMIEVPSSALMADAIAEDADFLSIGTNDLVQYILAADRGNVHTANLYFSTHPSILRLIRMVVESANDAKRPLVLCGESAADPLMIPLLLGLGVREFSVAMCHIPQVKHTIRKWKVLDACRLAEGALDCRSAKELEDFLAGESVYV